MAKSAKSRERHVRAGILKYSEAWREGSWAVAEGGVPPPYDQPNSKLKRSVYRLVRYCLEHDLLGLLKKSVEFQLEGKSRVKPSLHNAANPFYWGLTAVCGADNKLPRSSKSRFAQELQYAHMHNVPPEFLVGFIYQIGSSKDLQRKIDNKEMQPWFKGHDSVEAE